MTTTTATSIVSVCKQLREGLTHAQVASNHGLTEEQVRELVRDIPGLDRVPTVPARLGAATPTARPGGLGPQATAAVAGTGITAPVKLVQETPTAAAVASPIGKLLEDASAHSVAKVRALAGRIETQLDQLRGLLKEHEAAEAARRAEAEAKDKARAEVARLEQQLAAAKAKLRGTAATTHSSVITGVTCGKCGKAYRYAKARDKHQTTCTGPSS